MKPVRLALILSLGIPSLTACNNDEADTHGVVKVELLRKVSNDDPFVDTVKMTVTLSYTPCLTEFYTESHTEWAQEGIDGGPVWADFAERLCDRDLYPEGPECEIVSIAQNLGSVSATNLNMKVTMNILNPDLTGVIVPWGPMPKENLTDGCKPEVNLDNTSVFGFNTANEVIWGIASTSQFTKAVTGQNAAIVVDIERQTP